MNYGDLINSPKQLRYDKMCREFAQLADLAADDEGRLHLVVDWIKL